MDKCIYPRDKGYIVFSIGIGGCIKTRLQFGSYTTKGVDKALSCAVQVLKEIEKIKREEIFERHVETKSTAWLLMEILSEMKGFDFDTFDEDDKIADIHIDVENYVVPHIVASFTLYLYPPDDEVGSKKEAEQILGTVFGVRNHIERLIVALSPK